MRVRDCAYGVGAREDCEGISRVRGPRGCRTARAAECPGYTTGLRTRLECPRYTTELRATTACRVPGLHDWAADFD